MLIVTNSLTLRVPMIMVTECPSTVLVPLEVVTFELVTSRNEGSESKKATLVAAAVPLFLILNSNVIV